MLKKKIIIEFKTGLCNRLRILIPLISLLNEINMKYKIAVIWPIDEHCNGFFLDYFQKINRITFVRNKESIKKFIKKQKNNISFINKKNIKNLYNEFNIFHKQFFKLNDNIYTKIKRIIRKLSNKYIAVHIRRTDLDKHLKYKKIFENRTTDKDFINFIDKNKNYNLYIATDNHETQNFLIKRYRNRIKYIKIIGTENKNKRQTELEDAIIDLFVCICANKFKGTFYSSFSNFIDQIRNNILLYQSKKIINNPINKLKLFN